MNAYIVRDIWKETNIFMIAPNFYEAETMAALHCDMFSAIAYRLGSDQAIAYIKRLNIAANKGS